MNTIVDLFLFLIVHIWREVGRGRDGRECSYLVCLRSSVSGKEDWDKILWLNKLATLLIYLLQNEIQSQQLADDDR